jgi:hypothetical protein
MKCGIDKLRGWDAPHLLTFLSYAVLWLWRQDRVTKCRIDKLRGWDAPHLLTFLSYAVLWLWRQDRVIKCEIDKLRVHFPYLFSQRTGIQEEYLANFLNDNVRGQTNNSERNLSDCYSAYYKSQNNWPGIKIAPSKLWGREVAVWWYKRAFCYRTELTYTDDRSEKWSPSPRHKDM